MSAPPTATSAAVATLIPERVSDPGGDFSPTTNPTQAGVQALIAQVVGEVQTQVGINVDSSLAAFATLVVATEVAAQVELAFTNDLAPDAQSKYEQLHALYKERLAMLAKAQTTIDQGGTIGEEAGEVQEAVFYVPDTINTRYDMTRWTERY